EPRGRRADAMLQAMPGLRRFLPRIDSIGYHVLLGAVAILILGPLGGITAAYMNFSLGFFVGGQVLAGILGSVVTYGYGADAKLGGGTLLGLVSGVGANALPTLAATGYSASTLGAGMIVGARIGIPAVVFGAIGVWLTPWLRTHGWLDAHAPFRKIGFIVALG